MNGNCIACQEKPSAPRVVVVGLASCFGCQLQITNAEAHLLDVLGQIDLRYWQLASSDPMPEDFDVAIIEGAVTTEESEATVRSLREKAGAIIAVGACATTAGIPGMAAEGFLERPGQVYDRVPSACGDMVAPRAVGVNLGRPCNGCRGLSPDANLASAREAVARYGVSVADFDQALEMFNQTNPALAGSE